MHEQGDKIPSGGMIAENLKQKTEMETKNLDEEHKRVGREFKEIPPWTKQITVRGLVASLVIGVLYSVVIMKLNLTTGITPNLNVSAALVAFVFIRSWMKLLKKAGYVSTAFTEQENTVIQTCTVACYAVSLGGGFGSYLLGLNKKTYEQAGVDTEGNAPGSYKEPAVGWMTGFLFVTCFVGLFALVPLRKIMIVDYKLTYPSGTASGVLINGFHSPQHDCCEGFAAFKAFYEVRSSPRVVAICEAAQRIFYNGSRGTNLTPSNGAENFFSASPKEVGRREYGNNNSLVRAANKAIAPCHCLGKSSGTVIWCSQAFARRYTFGYIYPRR